jgi:hypothetical protein
MIPFECDKCKKNYCIKHRLEIDHDCSDIVRHSVLTSSSLNPSRLYFFQKQASNELFSSKNDLKNEHNVV